MQGHEAARRALDGLLCFISHLLAVFFVGSKSEHQYTRL